MLQEFKLVVVKMFNNPNARILLILGLMVLAILIAGAPADRGSG